MKTKLSRNITYWLGVVAIGLVVGLSLQFVRAWTEPSVAPPGGNIGAPINTSINPQIKSGGLQVNGFINAGNSRLDGTVAIGLPSSAVKLGVAGTIEAVSPDGDDDYNIGLYREDDQGYGHSWRFTHMRNDSSMQLWEYRAANNGDPCDGGSGEICKPTLTVKSGGNVGIGTTNPGTNKLQVNGKIQAIGGDVCTDQGGGKCLSTAGGGGALAETTVSCSNTQTGPNADCSITCPGGYVRSGCSSRHFTFYNAGMRILDGAYPIGNGCNCKTTGSGWPDPDPVGVVCIAYCLKAQ